MSNRTYSDEQLVCAVAAARSWRGVLRELGLSDTSSGSRRSIQRHARRLGLSSDHFTGQRRWTDLQLAHAVKDAVSWLDAADRLGLSSHGNTIAGLRAHALRLGIDTGHLSQPTRGAQHVAACLTTPRREHLRDAGPNLAAAWFLLCGHAILWPLEPCRYDFVAHQGDAFLRIQVKTTTYRSGATTIATISSSGRDARTLYSGDDIDFFFIIDAALDAYLIPVDAVAGRQTVSLSAYDSYCVARHGLWLPKAA